jgi:hypothetical protein
VGALKWLPLLVVNPKYVLFIMFIFGKTGAPRLGRDWLTKLTSVGLYCTALSTCRATKEKEM